MKLIFSEDKSDYDNYRFPYAIWAIPEPHETPAMIFSQGFLPSSKALDRFYLCRQIRVNLAKFERSSENRRILRKGSNISFQLVPRSEFEFSDQWQTFCKNYADKRFGKDVMTDERLESLFYSKMITHLLIFSDSEKKQNIGLVSLYLEANKIAYYPYSFYDLEYENKNLGMYMMTSAVDYFSQQKFDYIYLGTCYSRRALYKTQFIGMEFFNGFRWSDNLKELKFLIEKDQSDVATHLLENEDYVTNFHDNNLQQILKSDQFQVRFDKM